MAAADQAVGVFWGGRAAAGGGSRSASSRAASATHLPKLLPDAACSLLQVLHTLLRSIQSDSNAFARSSRALDPPPDGRNRGAKRYYSAGVEAEDRDFFVREREAEADRDAAQAAVGSSSSRQHLVAGLGSWSPLLTMLLLTPQMTRARALHCAVADQQLYACDRRRQAPRTSQSLAKAAARGTRAGDEGADRQRSGATAESARIDRQRRKSEHLLHVFQAEIAQETRREITFLELSSPSCPASRQTRRQLALITKARYEAADRIMRILEEYKIVVGVAAAVYLQRTIAEGKALMA